MREKLTALALSLLLVLGLTGCGSNELTDAIIDAGLEIAAEALLEDDDTAVIGGADAPTGITVTEDGGTEDTADTEEPELPYTDGTAAIDEDGTYNSAEDVSLYLHTYGRLPDNYLTKSEARQLGWEGGSVERWAGEGTAIGGSHFGNNEGLLPEAKGRQYYECDIDTVGKSSRGAKRIVWSNDGLIYYTRDHYESFELLYGEE